MTTTDQSHQIIAALATNTDWSKVRFESARLQERVVRDPVRAAEQFVAFLNNGCQIIVGEPKILQIDRSQPFDPVKFIGKGWTIWKGPIDGDGLKGDKEQDSRALAITDLDLTKIRFETGLKGKVTSMKGETKLARLKEAGHIHLDAGVFQTLWQNQHLIPHQWKEQTNGNTTFIFFDGTVLRHPGGDRCVLCLFWNGGEWGWDAYWLWSERDASRPSAVLASEN
jgi:hypothetical protein